MSWVASRARAPGTREVTSRKRWPFVRVCAPTRGSTCSAVSGESAACSVSETTPSFIWIRCATAVRVASLLGSGRDYRTATPRRFVPSRRYAGTSASSDRDAQLTHLRAARCPAEGLCELLGAKEQLLADDRCVRLHDQGPTVDPERATGAVGCRRALGDDRVERGQESRPAELVRQAQAGGGVRDQRADPRHRPASAALAVLVHQPASVAPASPRRTPHRVALARNTACRAPRR